MNSQTFLAGTMILAISNLFVKILGSVFRIPLGNLIGSDGIGYYQTAYPLYVFVLAISTSGMPTAISKMVAERTKLKRYKTAHKIFKISLLLLTCMGILSFLLFFFGANLLAKFLNDENSYYSIKALSLALLIVPAVNAFKGYFQGRSNMLPTSLSQISEQFVRVFFGLFLAYILIPNGKPIAAAGAAFGASLGAVIAFFVIIVIYIRQNSKIQKEINMCDEILEEDSISLLKEMMSIAVPIIIGSLVIPLMNTIDSKIIKDRLMSGGFSYQDANSLFGQYSGMAATIINLPQALTVSIAYSIVPAISESYVVKEMKKLRSNIVLGTRLSNLIAMPCFFGVMVLSTPIMKLLYPKEPDSAGSILFAMSFTIVLIALLQTFTAILQAIGKPMIPVINLFIASVFKIVITYFITPVPAINVKGAAIGTAVAYVIAMVLDYIWIKKMLGVNFKIKSSFAIPFLMSAIMGIFVKVSYVLFSMIIPGSKISTLLAVMIGGVVYIFELLFMGGISQKQLMSTSIGRKIASRIYKN
ncbi:MAG: putative polysaccharide biosynthesis protein [Peptoanaerobacter stomatis]|uniref:putative polysaccharide biosynthesis protein n=1 Tax=Peptoanaerobacter stomatis TaxID=796937 RepID=UPI003F9F02D9